METGELDGGSPVKIKVEPKVNTLIKLETKHEAISGLNENTGELNGKSPVKVKVEPKENTLIKHEAISGLNENLQNIKQEVTAGYDVRTSEDTPKTEEMIPFKQETTETTCTSICSGVEIEPEQGDISSRIGVSTGKKLKVHNAGNIKSNKKCNFCDFIGKNERKVAIHKRDTHGVIDPILLEKKKRKLTECDEDSCESNPTEKNKFCCNLCSKKSSVLKSIVQHKRIMHNIIDTDLMKKIGCTVVCDLCSEVLWSKSSLNKHKRKKHNPYSSLLNHAQAAATADEAESKAKPQLVCEMCHNSFPTKKSYEKHKKKHNIFVTEFKPAKSKKK